MDSKVCEWTLAADERIRFAMHIDDLGNLLCMKSVGYSEVSEDLALRLGNTLAAMAGSLLKDLSAVYGSFEYAMVKHGVTVTVGLRLKNGYLIFSAKADAVPEIIRRVRKTIGLYKKRR